jgi:putative ABC transport system ATP-binding protein
MLNAQNLELTFNPGTPIETRALRGLSLSIPDGQFVTVIGSNGAGKSTFLNCVRATRAWTRARSKLPAST